VCAVEAVKLEDLDPEAVRAGLSEYQAKLGSLQARTCLRYLYCNWSACTRCTDVSSCYN
jgi:hypothetical protein